MSPPKESPPQKMLILRGNSDKEGKQYPDEQGNIIAWPDGALHEKAALAYATCRHREGEVLPVPGDPEGDRDKNTQTMRALDKLREKDSPFDAIYGFSGGGYDVLHILRQLKAEELKRLKLVVVLGAPPVGKDGKPTPDGSGSPQESDFRSSRFGKPENGIDWELLYITNPPGDFKTPKNDKKHMFGPEYCSRKRNARKSHLDGPPAMAKRWRATAESPIRLRRDQRRAEAVGALVLADGRRRVRAAEADEYRWHGRGVILIRMHHHCAPVVAPQVGF